RQCHGRDDFEFGSVHSAGGGAESGHSDGEGGVSGGRHKVSLGTGDHHGAHCGERDDIAYVGYGGSRGHAAVFRDGDEHQQYGSVRASKRGGGRQCHGRDDFEFGSVHSAGGGAESGHSDGE